jgi:hypothetical protein
MIVEFIGEDGGGPGVRLRKARRKKLRPTAWQPLLEADIDIAKGPVSSCFLMLPVVTIASRKQNVMRLPQSRMNGSATGY